MKMLPFEACSMLMPFVSQHTKQASMMRLRFSMIFKENLIASAVVGYAIVAATRSEYCTISDVDFWTGNQSELYMPTHRLCFYPQSGKDAFFFYISLLLDIIFPPRIVLHILSWRCYFRGLGPADEVSRVMIPARFVLWLCSDGTGYCPSFTWTVLDRMMEWSWASVTRFDRISLIQRIWQNLPAFAIKSFYTLK